MSLPSIPNITPIISLTRCETVNLLLASIAMEEIGLAHVMNAEGEKIQKVLKDYDCLSICDLLKVNDSVENMLKTIAKNQMLLTFKLEDVLKIEAEPCEGRSSGSRGSCGDCGCDDCDCDDCDCDDCEDYDD